MSMLTPFQRLLAPSLFGDLSSRSTALQCLNLYIAELLRSAAAAQRYDELRRMDCAERARQDDAERPTIRSSRSFAPIGRIRRLSAIAADGEGAHCVGCLLHQSTTSGPKSCKPPVSANVIHKQFRKFPVSG